MADSKYDIYFRGEILPDYDEQQVKASIANLFKANDEKLAQLFSGKVNTIKKSVDKPTAAKYQQAFKKAGAKAVITLAKTVDEENQPVNNPDGPDWGVLPAGSDLLKPDERRVIPDANIDISQIAMVSPFAEIDVEEEMVPAAPETDHISVADVGEDMNPGRKEPVPDLELDLSEFSVAEAGATLVDKEEEEVPSAPDTSHIKLV